MPVLTCIPAMKIAKEKRSTVLASNAVHHRIDSLTSIVALIAIGASHLVRNATYFDPLGGLIVSLMVVHAGYQNTKTSVMELADVGLDEEIKDSVREATEKALATRSENVTIGDIGGIKSGQNLLVEITLGLDPNMSVAVAQEVERDVREIVGGEVLGVKRVKVRFAGDGKAESEFISEELQAKAGKKEEEKKTI